MIPEELNKIFERFCEDELNISITKIEFWENVLTISFTLTSITTEEIDAGDKRWVMQTVGHRRNRISLVESSDIWIAEDHSLLWEYKDEQYELYFNGQGSNPEKLYLEFYKLHFELFKNYVPVETYLNAPYAYNFLMVNNGLLARGPKRLILRYAECLKNNGVDFSILEGRPKQGTNLVILFMMDTDNYIIAEDFLFSRQSV